SYYYRSLCYSGKGRQTLEGIDLSKALQLGAVVEDADESADAVAPHNSHEVVMALRAALREAALSDLDQTVRALAGEAITQLDTQAPAQVPALLEALSNDEAAVRFGAAHALGDLKAAARPALGALTQALQDRDLGVRVQAARALWRIDQQVETTLPILI